MDILSIINKKSLNKPLTKQEIEFFVNGYLSNEITDYQASALLMAIKINGMADSETFALTSAILNSGEIVDLSGLGFCVDKHSTGGVSDTTTIALAPICACCGVNMLKLSGRSLGFTGGTIDKLESFDGYNVEISIEKAKELVAKNGACVISASQNLAPADKKLYALRNATSTVESIPLIASSIMSKKLASGASGIVLDIKYGNGAFMKTKQDAKKLAELMVKIGKKFGKKMDYVLGNMDEPLGYNIGNKLEAYEAIEVLSGRAGKLRDETINLASKCISMGLNITQKDTKKMAEETIASGAALEKFKTMVKAQGGSIKLFGGLKLKPKLSIKAQCSGTLTKINCSHLGELVSLMGSNRQKIDGEINYDIGIKTFHKIGDPINVGDTLFEVYSNNKKQALSMAEEFVKCYTITQ